MTQPPQSSPDSFLGAPAHTPTDAPAPPRAREEEVGPPVEGLDDFYTSITPGLVISLLPAHRAVEIADALDVPPSVLGNPADGMGAARKLLALLTDTELRSLARHVGMPADGSFTALYQRLAMLC